MYPGLRNIACSHKTVTCIHYIYMRIFLATDIHVGISIDQRGDNIPVHKEPRYLPARGSPIRQKKKKSMGRVYRREKKLDQRGESPLIQSLLATAVGPHSFGRLESTGTKSKLKSPAEDNQLRGFSSSGFRRSVVQHMVRYLSDIYQRSFSQLQPVL